MIADLIRNLCPSRTARGPAGQPGRPSAGHVARRPAGHTARLSELGPGDVATVVGIDAGDPRAMHKLLALGVMPGSQVEIRQCYPAFVFRLGYAQLAVDEQIASAVLVRR